MGSITLTSRQKNRRLPQVDVPVIADNDELRRFSESIKEHLRMYEGDSGAPKERFVTIEELEHVGLVTTKVQQGFASIDKILGEQIAAVPSATPTAGTPGATGAAGANTLRALDDTAIDGIEGGQGIVWNGSAFVPAAYPSFDLDGATRYDMMYFDGSDWVDTKQELQWNPTDDYLQLANAHSINWLDTADASKSFLIFDDASLGGVSEAEHHTFFQEGAVTTTSTSYVLVTGATFADSNLESGKDYILIVRAIGESTETASGGNGIRVAIGGVGSLVSEKHYESPNGTPGVSGHPYYFVGRITAGGGDITVQHKSSHATRTHSTAWIGMLLIKVEDLIEGTNIITAQTSADPGVALNTSTFTSFGAPITFGDGVSDWLLIGGFKTGNYASSSSIWTQVDLNDGASTIRVCDIANDDINDSQVMGWSRIYSGIASTTFNMEGKISAFAGEGLYSFMCAIRLNAFAEYFFDQDLGPITPPDSSLIDVATIAETATVTSSNWGFFGASLQHAGSSTALGVGELPVDINGAGDVELGNPSGYIYRTHAAASFEYISTLLFTEDQTINSGQTIDADIRVPPAGTPSNVRFENNFILAFTWDLAAVPENTFDVGNVAYPTRMIGLTTRFYDPGLTDYVEFDHDDIDFNITGFQTADINITGITAINAGTVNVDFDAITATSYGGILEANLVDKTAPETIAGLWTHSGRLVTDDSTTARAGFNIPVGVAPTSPVQGDVWSTATDLFMELSGGTETNAWIADMDALVFDDLFDVDLAGAGDNDLLHRSGGDWIDTAGGLTWDGSVFATTGVVSIPAGAVGAPSLYFTGDANTGVWSPGADIFAITAGAIETVRYTEASSHILADHSMESGITASTTQTQGERPLLSSYNEISVCANNDDVVTMPPASKGRRCLVINKGAKRLQLFPASGDDIGAGADTSVTIKVNTSLLFVGIDGTTWHDVATRLESLQGVNLTGAADNDLLHRSGGDWIDTAGALTFDGTDFVCGGDITGLTIGGITAANLLDKAATESVAGPWTYSGNLISSGYFHLRPTTTAALDAIANAINTDAGKVGGAMVWNSDTDNPVIAVGSADGDIWVDGAGATAHSPA